MINKLFDTLHMYNLTISSAESITGGRFSSLLVNVPGASNYLKGGFVCYTEDFKYDVLKVSRDIEIVSKEMAMELAWASKDLSGSSIAIAFTGNASESGIEGKPKGLSYIAVTDGRRTEVVEFQSRKEDREEIIEDTAIEGVRIILNFLSK